MKASAGEVYTVYNQYLKRYTACQVAYIAPPDTVSKEPWAVILSLDAASSPEAQDPMRWRGQNLLGFALMEVRDELRRVTQNEMLCDWSTVWQK